jgi:hypothetical protein
MVRTIDVPRNHSWLWIKNGFAIFRKAPTLFMGLLALWIAIYFLLTGIFGAFGQIAFVLIYPALSASLMFTCQQIEMGQRLQFHHLLMGFRNNFRQLLSVGSISLAFSIILGILLSFIVPSDPDKLAQLSAPNPDLAPLLPWLLTTLLVQLIISVPVIMALWFAPQLLIFQKMSVNHAIRWSFYACFANMGTFSVYGLICFGLFVLGLLPAGLGLLIAIPTIVISNYSSYKDIFVES